MGDGYWDRQPLHPSSAMLKRPRSDYELPPSGLTSGHELHSYLARDDDCGGLHTIKDTKHIGSAYDRYLQSVQAPLSSTDASDYAGIGLGRTVGGRMTGLQMAGPEIATNGRGVGFGGQLHVDPVVRPGRETAPLPPEASNTLYIEGLPPDSTRREVAHIFRPFVGYKEVRLVSKESKHRGGDPLILCFVDFVDPACAATALSALQGYKMDENDPDSVYLRLQFSRYPGPRSGPPHRGRRPSGFS